MSEQNSIKDTLNIIRKALEDDSSIEESLSNKNILILDKLVKEDGTIEVIQNEKLNKNEIIKILNENISKYFDKNLDKWLDKNMSKYLDDNLKSKK